MSEHGVRLEWTIEQHHEREETYSRDHRAIISPTVTIPVSAAPGYLGNERLADPEQLLVNALASCHMLYFLALCEGSGYAVASYSDDAVGKVEKSADGFHWVSEIVLRPRVTFASEKQPNQAQLERLHHRAHKGCFIANSIKSKVEIVLG
ncbi:MULTISPECIES: OsmC family protein [Burkholderia cepacia complex]|uniref:OsmC family protein n=1 Tax=Burkholderia cepacia complex TaxID=87882 RepID=UPI002148D55B|nr:MULTISPECIES: OsmC family protein [Burkholderia cepacia complex]MEB2500104.1 OsmC family protein [Burkholderia cenocepacia]MEB2557669.1 OsmC family protein [Burkholderia cenocepacia]